MRGQATHAARRTEGVSSIEKFWPLWQAIADLEARRHTTIDERTARWPLAHPISIGTVQCGDWPLSVPDLLVAEGRMGVAIGEPTEAAGRLLEEAIADACARDPWLRAHPAEIEWRAGSTRAAACRRAAISCSACRPHTWRPHRRAATRRLRR